MFYLIKRTSKFFVLLIFFFFLMINIIKHRITPKNELKNQELMSFIKE